MTTALDIGFLGGSHLMVILLCVCVCVCVGTVHVHKCSSGMCTSNLLPLSSLGRKGRKLCTQVEWVPQDP